MIIMNKQPRRKDCRQVDSYRYGRDIHAYQQEITSIENGVMTWNALREESDGTRHTIEFKMTKVE